MKIIARIRTEFKEKFGIPRQSGIVAERGVIVFEPEYRAPEALRGIEGYSHLWLIWEFSEAKRESWSPTVRPPRLGGNKRIGVFATRSPYRPNPIGLSSVRLVEVKDTDDGRVLVVEGADILDGTPIYDIKPYLSYTDSHPDAVGGFADGVRDYSVEVEFSPEANKSLRAEDKERITALLKEDPRPSYKSESDREYGMLYGEWEIFFIGDAGSLTVTRAIRHKSR
ncbi:MAG: tRNA (N6-threonylcarbamoyladenosine(37)-N6)-methyltransferase TrmO [Clostridia bacterium]|nr:tRNA (N6-threonylcarbamoyladenosine(37)-N6)-methyltransferase TrmO [Clostridia bacterium]